MAKFKKISLWITGIFVVLAISLSALILLAAQLINQESIKNRIQAEVSRAIDGQVEFERLGLSFFPHPHLMIHRFSFSIPETATGTLESIDVRPKIMPLFMGKLRIARIDLIAPGIEIRRGERKESKDKGFRSFSFGAVKEKVGPIFSFVSSKGRGLTILVEKGRLNFLAGKKADFWFRDIYARIALPTDKINLDIQCNSSLWEGISLKGIIDPKSFSSAGSIELAHIHPQFLTGYLFPLTGRKASAAPLNLNVKFITDGFKSIQANVEGSMAYLALQHPIEDIAVKGLRFRGSIDFNEDKSAYSLDELKLDYPLLNMSGKLDVIHSTQSDSSGADLTLKATNVDVPSTRKIVLALAGEVPVVNEIFNIVKGGRLPNISITSSGNSIRELVALENTTILGSLRDGEIFVPEVDLDLKDVKGEVVISNSLLQGKDLEARLGNTAAKGGTLRLCLMGENALFHLDTAIEADLAQLPSILMSVIDNNTVKELALVEDLKGKATGRLVLGDSITSIEPDVKVTQFNLSANYRRLPYAVKVNGGQFSYKGDKIALKNTSGSMGKSFFSDLSLQLDLNKGSYLEVNSGESSFFMEEIFPWLSSYDTLNGKMKQLDTVKGVFSLSALSFQGPLSAPENCHFQTAGEIRSLKVNSPLYPETIEIPGGRFNITEKDVSVSNLHANFSNSSLQVSGAINGYLKGVQNLDLRFDGKMGPTAIERVFDILKLPPQLDLKPPISVSAAHLTWNNRKETAFSGHLGLQHDLDFSMDIILKPDELIIKKFVIQDRASHAAFKLTSANRAFDLSFVGNLNKSTMDRIVLENKILGGWIKGDFHTHVVLDKPMNATAQGHIQVKDLVFPWMRVTPVTINTLSMDAGGNTLRIESSDLSWADSRVDLKGSVNILPEGFLLDLDLFADAVNVDRFQQILNQTDKEKQGNAADGVWLYPIEGAIKLKTEKLTYAGFAWSPLYADVTLKDKAATVSVTEGKLCGIATPGVIKISPEDITVDVKPLARNQGLQSSIHCLLDKSVSVDGNFNLDANITAQGPNKDLIRSLRGNLELAATEGRFYAGRFHRVLNGIFGLLNITDIFKGKLPDVTAQGFGYNSILLKADIKNSKIVINEMLVDGTSMDIIGHGTIDLIEKKIDASALVAPFQTVDFFVKKTPVVKDIFEGTLVSVPVSIKGNLENPRVTPLSPSLVGSELLGIMKRTVKIPFQIIESVLDGREKD